MFMTRSFCRAYTTNEEYLQRFRSIPNVHSLAKGMPSPNKSIDLVNHLHSLKHLDSSVAERILLEAIQHCEVKGFNALLFPTLNYYVENT